MQVPRMEHDGNCLTWNGPDTVGEVPGIEELVHYIPCCVLIASPDLHLQGLLPSCVVPGGVHSVPS